MNIFLVRHGQAQYAAATDFDRELTPRGREETRWVAGYLRQATPALDEIWVSPLIRAQQTAAIFLETFSSRPRFITQDQLAPSGNINLLVEMLDNWQGQDILLVSHQPLVGQFLSLLVDGVARDSGSDLPPMGTSALAHIRTDIVAPGCAELHAFKLPVDL